MKPIRVAVVGCGALANGVHLPNIAANKDMQLAVTCDSDLSAAKAAREKWGAERVSAEWSDVVKSDDVDLIVLATHTNLRSQLIVPALKAGKPVYCEKPLSHDRRELYEIIRAESVTGVPVCVGHNRRCSPAVREMLRLLRLARERGCSRPPTVDRRAEGRGRIYEEEQTQAVVSIVDDSRSWKAWTLMDPDETQLLNEMTHFIDLGLLIMEGKAPVRVACEGSPRGNFVVVITFHDGSMATFTQTLSGNFDYPKEFIEVSHGYVSLAMFHHVEVWQRGLEGEPFRSCFPLAAGSPEVEEQGIAGYNACIDRARELYAEGKVDTPRLVKVRKGHDVMLDTFARSAVYGEGANPSPARAAYAPTVISFRAQEACRLGTPVRLSPEDFSLPL